MGDFHAHSSSFGVKTISQAEPCRDRCEAVPCRAAHRLLCHSIPGSRVIKKKKRIRAFARRRGHTVEYEGFVLPQIQGFP
jgi:hypothetical protein